MIWVINVNSNQGNVYEYTKHPADLRLIKTYDAPQTKLKNSELTTDRPGHYQGGESARGAYEPRLDAKEIEIENFLRHIGKAINKDRNENQFTQLILIAPASVMGQLNKFLDKQVITLMSHQFQKDLLKYTEAELLAFLKENTQFCGVNK